MCTSKAVPVAYQALDLWFGYISALQAVGSRGVWGLKEHIPAAQQPFCSGLVQDHAAVNA